MAAERGDPDGTLSAMALNSLRRALARESAAQQEFPEMITVLEHRMMAVVLALIGLTVATGGTAGAGPPQVQRHVVVFRREAAFAGWPANHGLWSWGNEILVGFSVGSHRDLGEERHNIDRDKPEYHVLARSLDGGETWSMEYPNDHGMLINSGGMRHGTTDPRHLEPAAIPLQQPMNFTHPDFCMTPFEMQARFSSDSGNSWSSPVVLNTGGGGRDIGYPQSVQRPDGRIVTIYYFYTQDDTLRRIVATIWDPGSAER